MNRRDFVVSSAWLLAGRRLAKLDPRVRELEQLVSGSVLVPVDSSALVYNERYAHVHPLAVVRPRGPRNGPVAAMERLLPLRGSSTTFNAFKRQPTNNVETR